MAEMWYLTVHCRVWWSIETSGYLGRKGRRREIGGRRRRESGWRRKMWKRRGREQGGGQV